MVYIAIYVVKRHLHFPYWHLVGWIQKFFFDPFLQNCLFLSPFNFLGLFLPFLRNNAYQNDVIQFSLSRGQCVRMRFSTECYFLIIFFK